MVDIDYKLDEPWTILSAIEQSIKKKIESIGTPLKDWDIRINYGIKTGLNDAFIISKEKRDELVKADPKSDEIIRPILRGKDIGRNFYTFADLYVITAYKGISLIMKETYPAVFEHLKQFEDKLRKRGQCEGTATSPGSNQHHWLELDNNVSQEKLDDFSRQKIYYREISDAMNAVFVEDYILITNKSYMMTGKDVNKNLLSFLNSNIFNRIMLQQANLTGGKGPSFFKNIPLPLVIKSEDRITEDVLNRFYDLSPEEISYIEKASNK